MIRWHTNAKVLPLARNTISVLPMNLAGSSWLPHRARTRLSSPIIRSHPTNEVYNVSHQVELISYFSDSFKMYLLFIYFVFLILTYITPVYMVFDETGSELLFYVRSGSIVHAGYLPDQHHCNQFDVKVDYLSLTGLTLLQVLFYHTAN